MAPHFKANFDNYLKLFDELKTQGKCEDHIYIFFEVMLNKSPCNITYEENLKGNCYIFQILTDTVVSHEKNCEFIKSTGLTPVPYWYSGKFSSEFLQKVSDDINKVKREGVILSFPDLNLGFKFKYALYDSSSYWKSFTEEDLKHPIFGKIA